MIRTLIDRQIEVLVRDLIVNRIKSKKDISLYEINQFKGEANKTLSNFQSLFQAYDLPSRSGEGLYKIHRKNVEDLNNDFRILNSIINDVYGLLDKLIEARYVSSIYKQNILQRIIVMAKDIITSLISKSNAVTIDFSDLNVIDQQETTALIDTDTKQCKCKELSDKDILYFGDYEESDISTSFKGESITSSSKNGLVSNLLKKGYYNFPVTFTINQEKRSECRVVIDIPVARDKTARRANNISVEILDYVTDVACQFSVSKDSKNFIPVTEVLPNTNNKYSVSFEGDNYTYVRIEFIKGIEDDREGNTFIYRVGIKSLSVRNTAFSSSSVLRTKGIQRIDADENVLVPKRVAIDVNDFIPPNTSVEYYVRTASTTWKAITPSNKAKAANNIIEFGAVREYIIDDIKPDVLTGSWKDLQPNNGFGNMPLYNILDKVPGVEVEGGNPLIENGQLKPQTETSQIDEASVTLYRGKDDYAVVYEPVAIQGKAEDIKYTFKYDSDNKLYERLTLFVSLRKIPFVVQTGGFIDFGSYEIVNPKHVSIIYEDKVMRDWTYDSDTNKIELVDVIAGKVAYVTFNASISSIEQAENADIDIDMDTMIFKNPLTETEYDANNFIVDLTNSTIDINPLNELAKDMYDDISINVSFDYKINRLNKGVFYRTYVAVKDETFIRIVPFTTDQIQKGNFHYIDGINISTLREFVLQPGDHVIETTQPYPSDTRNSDDRNAYTGVRCKAGIVLPSGVRQYAFELPQRSVSTFNLSNIVRINDHRSFAFANKAVWINRTPEFIPQYIMNDIAKSHTKGKELLGRKAIYNDALEFTGYVSVPETFTLIYKEKDIAGDEDDQEIYIKANMRILGNNIEITPVINSITTSFL